MGSDEKLRAESPLTPHQLDVAMWTAIAIVFLLLLGSAVALVSDVEHEELPRPRVSGVEIKANPNVEADVFCPGCVVLAPRAATIGKKEGKDPSKPEFVLRATRQMAFAGTPILLTAELKGGEEVEAYYCPKVIWTWADGTESSEEYDCPAFEKREEFPRTWRRWVRLAVEGAEYKIAVRWEKPAGTVIGRREIVLTALGGQ